MWKATCKTAISAPDAGARIVAIALLRERAAEAERWKRAIVGWKIPGADQFCDDTIRQLNAAADEMEGK